VALKGYFNICQEIIEAGKKLQSTGKNNAERNADLRLPAELEDLVTELESKLIDHLRPLTVQIYEGALKAAQRQVSETSRELKQLQSEVEAEIQYAKTIIEELEQRLTDTTNQLQESTLELKQSQEASYQFEREAIALGAEVKQLRENSTYEELMKRIIALESKGVDD
jgi:chromosome segregation ATPase